MLPFISNYARGCAEQTGGSYSRFHVEHKSHCPGPPVSTEANPSICSLIARSFGPLPNAPTFLDTLENAGGPVSERQFHRIHHSPSHF
jgi:hypothetical protein